MRVIKAFLLILVFSIVALAQDWKQPLPKGIYVDNGQVLVVPESERFLNYVVFGLWPNSGQYYFLPEMKNTSGLNKKHVMEVQKQFYWLNYELSHGRPIQNLPKYTHLYVALPDKNVVKESRGGEKEMFLEFLKTKRGYTSDDIKHKVHFFKSEIQLEWAQDSCKVLGRQDDGSVIMGYSEGDENVYIKTILNLKKSFPKDFNLKKFDSVLSAEGGDQDLIWLAPEKVGFLVGRHRVLAYLERKYGESYEGRKIPQDLIEEARAAYSAAVFGLDVVFMPENVLRDPSLGSEETFHLDMISTTMPDMNGRGYRVFIPTYGKNPIDAISLQPLDKNIMKAAQNEYDQAAAQFKKMGYDVVRLVFNDHPVRAPVNIGRFKNKETGKYTVLLGKYPHHLPSESSETPQAMINTALDRLNYVTQTWLETKSDDGYTKVMEAVKNMWEVMDIVCSAPNPVYQAQYDIFKKLGYDVVTIPVYSWGAGGLHCQMMY